MSSIYALEPATSGKVVLHTTVGDIEVELWAKETPVACRNFVQHVLDGYYRGCLFHRVVKDFIVQTGDPTNSGDGGEAAYGAPFPLEIHSRLRFNHRGVVAMASSAEGNASQFFFLMAQQAEQLNRKHTIFGKVAGDTIYNLAKINDSDLGANDRPLFPARITGAEILWDPFDGAVVARRTQAQEEEEERERKRKAKRKPTQTKNAALLSFGGGGEEEEEEETVGRGLGGRMKARQHFSKRPEVKESIARQEEEEKERKRKHREETARLRQESDAREAESDRAEAEDSLRSFDAQMRHRLLSSVATAAPAPPPPSAAAVAVEEKGESDARTGDKRKKRAGLRLLEQQRSKYRRRSKADRQALTLERLQKFQTSLRTVESDAEEAKKRERKEEEEEAELAQEKSAESYSARLMYGKVLDDDDGDDGSDGSWKAHRLKFARTVATANEDDYVVLDPTAPGAEGMAEKWGRGESGRNRGRGDGRRERGDDRRDRRSDRGGDRRSDRGGRERGGGDWGRERHYDSRHDRSGDRRGRDRYRDDRAHDSRDRRR